jgi:hypothetical protein
MGDRVRTLALAIAAGSLLWSGACRHRGPAAAPVLVPPCAADRLAPFPWPSPPQPSVTSLIPPSLLFGNGVADASLMDVAVRLDGAIARAGYRQPRYLGAGCDGFAIVLDLEQIESDGTRKAGAEGFAPPGQDDAFSLASYIRRLFYAPSGHYRQIVLVVSDERMAAPTAAPTSDELRAIAQDGVSRLPPGFAAIPYGPDFVVLALIYEFEKGPRDGDAAVVPPQGRLGATVHLMRAQLF